MEEQELPEVGLADPGQALLGGLIEDGLPAVVEEHLEVLADGAGEEDGRVPGPRPEQRRAHDREWVAGAAVETLKLVEADDDVVAQAGERAQLGVQDLPGLGGLRPALDRSSDDLQVEAELPLH